MSAVAVLLNFTSRLSFEETDPLMSLINAEGALLFYDRITTAPFPNQFNEREKHVYRQIVSLRNLLESRALSVEDQNEDIRLIFVLDLTDGVYDPQESGRKFFPAQKVRRIRKQVVDVFGENNPMLKRFEFAFIFLDSVRNNLADFYRKSAQFGLCRDNWIDEEDIRLNEQRDLVIQELSSPNDETALDTPAVKAKYEGFLKQCDLTVANITLKLKEADCDEMFRERLNTRLETVKTVGEFQHFNYDDEILHIIGDCIGLSSLDFREDCVFFLIRVETNTLRERTWGAVYLKSLVQLLSTASNEDYRNTFHTTDVNKPALLFVSETVEDGWIDTQKVCLLKNYIRELIPALEQNKLNEASPVNYPRYSLIRPKTATIDPDFLKKRLELYEDFRKKSKIPFFFGKNKNDWTWYERVLAKVAEIHQIESVNHKSLFILPARITDEDMGSVMVSCSYAELQVAINSCLEEQNDLERISLEDEEEKQKLFDLSKVMSDLKQKMVALGFLKWLSRIAFACVLFTTLCYALPFIVNSSSPVWIPLVLVIVTLLFIIGALIAHSRLKTDVSHVLDEVERCEGDGVLNHYEDKLNRFIRNQNRADVLKKNLDVMQLKYGVFTRHNKQVEKWTAYYKGIEAKLIDILNNVNYQKDNAQSPISVSTIQFHLDGFPTLPFEITNRFHQPKVVVGHTVVENATCFISNTHLIQQ